MSWQNGTPHAVIAATIAGLAEALRRLLAVNTLKVSEVLAAVQALPRDTTAEQATLEEARQEVAALALAHKEEKTALGWVAGELEDCARVYSASAQLTKGGDTGEGSKDVRRAVAAMLKSGAADAKGFAKDLKVKKEAVLKQGQEWALVGSCRGVTDVANKLETASQGMQDQGRTPTNPPPTRSPPGS